MTGHLLAQGGQLEAIPKVSTGLHAVRLRVLVVVGGGFVGRKTRCILCWLFCRFFGPGLVLIRTSLVAGRATECFWGGHRVLV